MQLYYGLTCLSLWRHQPICSTKRIAHLATCALVKRSDLEHLRIWDWPLQQVLILHFYFAVAAPFLKDSLFHLVLYCVAFGAAPTQDWCLLFTLWRAKLTSGASTTKALWKWIAEPGFATQWHPMGHPMAYFCHDEEPRINLISRLSALSSQTSVG